MDETVKKPIIIEADEVLLQENRNLHLVQKALEGALKQVFGEGVASERFLDKSRIPLICKNVEGLHENYKEMKVSNERQFKEIKENAESNFKDIKDMISDKYVLKIEFVMVQKIVYGAVAMILVAVVGALIYLVIKR